MYKKITSENITMFAIRHYDNPHCEGEKEFYDDMKRFKYIKRLLRKYKETNILKERLILNHIIIPPGTGHINPTFIIISNPIKAIV